MNEAPERDQTETRSERAQARTARMRTIVALSMGLVLVAAAVVAGIVWTVRGVAARSQRAGETAASSSAASITASAGVTEGMTEVPDLRGMRVDEASMVLRSAGFVTQATTEGTATEESQRRVIRQTPDPGSLAAPGAAVAIVVPPMSSARKPARSTSRYLPGAGFVVVIDPGHQSHSDTQPEPLGPGSKTLKASVTAGSAGVATKIPEYEIALELATNLSHKLETTGVKVVMTRTTNDVDLSNVERAAIANGAHADLFVRVHADASSDGPANGVSTLYPAPNEWTGPIVGLSRNAAQLIQRRAISATGAADRGAVQRTDVAGFNWAKVPSVQVEAGFPSNTVEDQLLSSPTYQDRLCQGISSGVLAYLKQKK